MKTLSRVVWSEGMHLGPHHFQAQSRYFEDAVRFAAESLWFAPYGLLGWELDADALVNGTVSISYARGVFPDGLPFHMPEFDALPAPRDIRDAFPALSDRATLLLAAPPERPDGRNCALEDEEADRSVRFIASTVVMPDENTGRDEKPVRLGRKNIRFLLDSELPAEDPPVTLPLARIVRDGAGGFSFDPEFTPPVLQIGASKAIMARLRRLIEILEEKCRSVARPRDLGNPSASGFSAQGIANAWFLHCVNQGLAPLRHQCFTKNGHPEELYSELARLAGALCTFGLDSHPEKLPLYKHDDLTECLAELDHHIRAHLELIVPSNCIEIPLEKTARYFWHGKLADQRVLNRSRWILEIYSKIGEATLIESTPRLAKVCSREFLPRLVERALPGLKLSHLPIPPPAVSPKVEMQYFAIDKAGPCWEHLAQTREMGVYVPGEIPDPEVRVFVVLDS
ncbi:MAG: type VI secretion system baseplate subunit TssK [Bryobacterales bacterium]|nr:type VI secretion system baseplate subunit TssK [Acidobacteriota bacterium]MCB9385585.1 type VI secretion system baseplate subunit TssK [Bryobacterales bacterium]